MIWIVVVAAVVVFRSPFYVAVLCRIGSRSVIRLPCCQGQPPIVGFFCTTVRVGSQRFTFRWFWERKDVVVRLCALIGFVHSTTTLYAMIDKDVSCEVEACRLANGR